MARVAFGLVGVIIRLAILFLVSFCVLILIFSIPVIGHAFSLLFGFMFALLDRRWLKFLPLILPLISGLCIWLVGFDFDYIVFNVITLQCFMLSGIWWGNFRRGINKIGSRDFLESRECQ